MKLNYVVSGLKSNSSISKSDVFYASEYCAYLDRAKCDGGNVAEYPFNSMEMQAEAYSFVEEKFEKYIDIISQRLNLVHKINFSREFWLRAISLGIFRQITCAYEHFIVNETSFDPGQMQKDILYERCYITCEDYEADRALYQTTHIGQEQLCAIYMRTFYPDIDMPQYEFWNIAPAQPSVFYKIFELYKKLKRNKGRLFSVLLKKFKFKFIYKTHSIKVGLLGTFFDESQYSKLVRESRGRVNNIELGKLGYISCVFDLEMREFISQPFDKMDRFDLYFFSFLKFAMPKIFIEGFAHAHKNARSVLARYSNLRTIVSEGWLTSTAINIFRAVAHEERGIETHYNEHNCVFHPYVGDLVKTEAKLVDKYLTFGWSGDSENFLSLGSLYQFKIPVPKSKKYDILYVSYPVEAKTPYFTSCYATSGYGASSHLKFVKKFFKDLPSPILNSIYYRGYPTDYFLVGLRYNKEQYIGSVFDNITQVSSQKYTGESCKQQMSMSRVVVIDFLSTAYIESLMMNIPTIVFFDKSKMFLAEKYCSFYDDLIEAKIIHTSPESAASHLSEVYANPGLWWNTSKTQTLKDKWLADNFGSPSVLFNYLLEIS